MEHLPFWAWLISFSMIPFHPFSCKWYNFIFLYGWAIFHGIYILCLLYHPIGCWASWQLSYYEESCKNMGM
jgi:hypothetical protein